ncbi:MAG TPA: transglycosylase SLT domain-containing protein [Bacteroidia bacterium]|nr:transglycosylase SLT domain-containing protein [Bacteroidia bacterium]
MMKKGIVAIAALMSFTCTTVMAQEPVFMTVCRPVSPLNDSAVCYVVKTDQIYAEGLDTVPQIIFWRRVMTLPPDSGLISRMGERTIYATWSTAEWDKLGETKQMAYRDSIRKTYGLSDSVRILFTAGKSDFYNPSVVIADIYRAVPLFMQEGVDPFYAQAILLIESPGKVRKSNAGAMGAFQLMPSVARSMGLKVNKKVDERKDFDKSSWAAAKLIKTVCIPQVNKMLTARAIAYDSTDLWYRLLVLHVYHAGAGNVGAAMNVIQPTTGGMWLVQRLWVTTAANFGNASQNYSQLAVSAMIEMDMVLKKEIAVTRPPDPEIKEK